MSKKNSAEAASVDFDRHGVGTVALGGGDLRVAFSCLEEADIADCFARIAMCQVLKRLLGISIQKELLKNPQDFLWVF